MRHLKLFLSFYICLLGSPLLAQPDTTEVDLGGESVEVSSFQAPVQQITSQQRWFQFFIRMDKIAIKGSVEYTSVGQDEEVRYEELPLPLILQDYRALQAYLDQKLFTEISAQELVDSNAIQSRQYTALWGAVGYEPGDSMTISKEALDYYTALILDSHYPLCRALLWRKVDWDPRLLDKDVIREIRWLSNPRYLATAKPLPDSLNGALATTLSAYKTYRSREDIIAFLRTGYENSSSSRSRTWFVRFMRPMQLQIHQQARDTFGRYLRYYNKNDFNDYGDYKEYYSGYYRVFNMDGEIRDRQLDTLRYDSLVSLAMASKLEEHYTTLLQKYVNGLTKMQTKWMVLGQRLDSLLTIYQGSLTELEVAFCMEASEDIQLRLEELENKLAPAHDILQKAQQSPTYERLLEMTEHHQLLQTHYIGGARRIEQLYQNDRLNELAQQVQDHYVDQVWALDREFLEKARLHHRP